MNPRRDVAALRLDAHRAIDDVFAPLAVQAEEIIERNSVTMADGTIYLDAAGALRARMEIRALLMARRERLILATGARIVAAERLAAKHMEPS